MATTTLWALRTWANITVVLLLIVGGTWLNLGTTSGWFWVLTATAVVAEYYVVRQLVVEFVSSSGVMRR